MNLATVKEQLVYEIGDPRGYMTPDVIVDFTSCSFARTGRSRRITGPEGGRGLIC